MTTVTIENSGLERTLFIPYLSSEKARSLFYIIRFFFGPFLAINCPFFNFITPEVRGTC